MLCLATTIQKFTDSCDDAVSSQSVTSVSLGQPEGLSDNAVGSKNAARQAKRSDAVSSWFHSPDGESAVAPEMVSYAKGVAATGIIAHNHDFISPLRKVQGMIKVPEE